MFIKDTCLDHQKRKAHFLKALFNPQRVNNACDPDKRKWLASSRDLKATLDSFSSRKEILSTDNDSKVKL